MRPSVIGVIVLVIVMALVEQAWAQPAAPPGEPPRLMLQQAIQTALDKHPALQSATFAVQGAEARAKQAESPYYPQVGGVAAQTNGALRANSVLRPAGALIQPNQSDMTVGVVASQTVYEAMRPTPQYCWPLLSERVGTEIWIKHENHTPLGAFKIRGGLVYFRRLRESGISTRRVVTATRGTEKSSKDLTIARISRLRR